MDTSDALNFELNDCKIGKFKFTLIFPNFRAEKNFPNVSTSLPSHQRNHSLHRFSSEKNTENTLYAKLTSSLFVIWFIVETTAWIELFYIKQIMRARNFRCLIPDLNVAIDGNRERVHIIYRNRISLLLAEKKRKEALIESGLLNKTVATFIWIRRMLVVVGMTTWMQFSSFSFAFVFEKEKGI